MRLVSERRRWEGQPLQAEQSFSTGKIKGLMRVRGLLADVTSELGRRIVAGEWASGSTLPTEVELMEQMEVGRSVIRESIRILNAKGLVRSRQMEGVKVMPRDEWRLLDPDIIHWQMMSGDRRALFDDLLHARLVVEPSAVRLATEAASAADRQRIHDAWAARAKALASTYDKIELQRDAFAETDLAFHRAFLFAAGSEILNQFVTVIEAAIRLMVEREVRNQARTQLPLKLDESAELHKAVYDAFCRDDAAGAEEAMRALLVKTIKDASEVS